jgi:hypothetical protein
VTRLRAGADVRAITPSLREGPVFLAGFQGDRRATAVNRDLCVRTLALAEDGRPPFVLTVCDLIGVPRVDTLTIRAAVADLGADVVVAATHTHSGPDTIGLWGPDETTSGVDDGYLATVRTQVEASIRAAVAALGPARMFAGTGSVEGVIRNYRDPDVLDAQVGVLAFDRPDGEAIATLVNVGVHPEVLDGGSTVVSPDMAGACCAHLDQRRGGVTVWASGDLGGMRSPEEGPRSPGEATRKGGIVADTVLRVLADAPVQPDGGVRVRYRGAEVELPLWNPRFRAGIEAGLLRGALAGRGTLTTDVGLLDLGTARAACWPGEVLPKLGMEAKRRLGTDAPLLVGLANDELGYILADEDFTEPDDWDDPGYRYEESMSVGPTTGSLLLAALEHLLDDLLAREPDP